VPEDFTNPEKNPYFDENLAAAPRERRSRPLKFAQQGKYINIANQIRTQQRAEQLRKEIEENAKANTEEEDALLKDGFTKVIDRSGGIGYIGIAFDGVFECYLVWFFAVKGVGILTI
jgi:hypothetical protein